jgi:hypothetical protein
MAALLLKNLRQECRTSYRKAFGKNAEAPIEILRQECRSY